MSREAISPQIDYQINRQYLKLERKKNLKIHIYSMKTWNYISIQERNTSNQKKKKKTWLLISSYNLERNYIACFPSYNLENRKLYK